jgi:hypothetical protein
MGTISDKLTHLSQTKSDIRDAIISKGISVPVETTFRDYATKVSDIVSVIGYSDTLNYAERVSQDGGKLENLAGVSDIDFNDGATLKLIPSGKKAGKAYSQIPIDGSGDFTVDRNSTASYIAEDGTIKFANVNEPRFDWSSGTRALLVEPQSTNLFSYSEDFSQNYWDKNSVALNKETTLSLAGNEMYKMTTTTTSSNTISTSGITLVNGTLYTVSFFYKYINSPVVRIGHDSSGSSAIWFNIQNGTVLTKNGSVTGKIEDFGNGWYRCSKTFTCLNENSLYQIFTGISGDGSASAGQTGLEAFIADGQIEEGSTATSYIKTEGATVTRLVDIIEITPPTGTTQIIETIDGAEQTPITTIPATYQIPEGNINKIKML